jgi:hypothetical protein
VVRAPVSGNQSRLVLLLWLDNNAKIFWVIMQGPIRLFCEVSGAEVHAGKAKGLHLGVSGPFQGVEAGTGILFVGSQDPIRHLGILVDWDTEHCGQEISAGDVGRRSRCTKLSRPALNDGWRSGPRPPCRDLLPR